MTAYHGGKQRIGKKLAEVIVDESIDIAEEERFEIKGYCEPFCGMLGVYRYIPELFEEEGFDELDYLAGDTNGSVIAMWKAAQKGWKPPITCSEAKYNKLKNAKDSAMRGFVGHQCSFGGQFFNGYSKKYDATKNPEKASKRVIKIGDDLSDVKFNKTHYDGFSGLRDFVIYCDPPYNSTISRYSSGEFDSSRFFEWCRRMSKHNLVFVSEYQAPKDFHLIYDAKKTKQSCYGSHNCKKTEKLYSLGLL